MDMGGTERGRRTPALQTDQEGIPRSMEVEDLSCTEGLWHLLSLKEIAALSTSPRHFHWQHPPPNAQTKLLKRPSQGERGPQTPGA